MPNSPISGTTNSVIVSMLVVVVVVVVRDGWMDFYFLCVGG